MATSRPTYRRYQVREKLFSIGDQFKIKDEHGHDMFIVKSKVLSIGDHLVLEDTNGNSLITIRQELRHLHPTFRIMSANSADSDDRSLAHVKQKLTFFHKKFTIDSVYGQYELEAEDLLAHSFKLTKDNQKVAKFDKKFLATSDNYRVKIIENENQAFILALVITINQILYTFHWQKLTIFK